MGSGGLVEEFDMIVNILLFGFVAAFVIGMLMLAAALCKVAAAADAAIEQAARDAGYYPDGEPVDESGE